MDDLIQGVLTAILLAFIVLPLLMLATYVQVRVDQGRKEWEREQERQARLKALYPEQPSYEERMGVQYGPQGPQEPQEKLKMDEKCLATEEYEKRISELREALTLVLDAAYPSKSP